jgi:hypothetical protein
MVALKNLAASSHVIFFNILASLFLFTEDNMNILNNFIYSMTCEMRQRTPVLGLTNELILHILKLVFQWNVVSMSHVHYFCDSLKYLEYISLK